MYHIAKVSIQWYIVIRYRALVLDSSLKLSQAKYRGNRTICIVIYPMGLYIIQAQVGGTRDICGGGGDKFEYDCLKVVNTHLWQL